MVLLAVQVVLLYVIDVVQVFIKFKLLALELQDKEIAEAL
jgi:hypothetical protein